MEHPERAACSSSTINRRTARARWPTSWRAQYPGRVEVMHRTDARGLGRSYVDGIRARARSSRSTSSARWTPTSRTIRGDLPRLIAATARADVVIGSRYVPGGAIVNWPLRRRLLSRFANSYIRAGDAPAARATAPAATAAGAARRSASLPLDRIRLGRLLVPGRDAVRGRAARASRSPRCRSRSSSGGRANRSCRARVLLESAITPWRLIARDGAAAAR